MYKVIQVLPHFTIVVVTVTTYLILKVDHLGNFESVLEINWSHATDANVLIFRIT